MRKDPLKVLEHVCISHLQKIKQKKNQYILFWLKETKRGYHNLEIVLKQVSLKFPPLNFNHILFT